MKIVLFTILGLTAAYIYACNSASNKEGAPREKGVNIVINDDADNPGRCAIVNPGAVTLSKKNHEKIKWCVINNCQFAREGVVTVDDFRAQADPNKKNPFGTGLPADNIFTIAHTEYDCKVKTTEATSGEDDVHYKYRIIIKAGEMEKGSLDPEVIIST